MFKKILYLIVITFLLFLVTGFFLPGTVQVERSISVSRPASTVFTLLNSFRSFTAWSPWSERDPQTVYEYSGPDYGPGARISWTGDPRLVGSGWQEIVESRPYSAVRMQLDFDQMGEAMSWFRIDSDGPGSRVTWGFEMDLAQGQGFFGGLIMRYFGLFFDRWFGSDYETGLSRLKAHAESLPGADFSDLDVAIVDVEPVDILFVPLNPHEASGGVDEGLAAAYREISALMESQSIEMLSQPMSISRSWDAENYEIDAAIPVSSTEVELSGNVRAGQSPSGRAVRVIHRGPYSRMPSSYAKLAAYMAVHGMREGRVSWEQYISNPGQTAPEDTITHIYFLVEDQPAKPD